MNFFWNLNKTIQKQFKNIHFKSNRHRFHSFFRHRFHSFFSHRMKMVTVTLNHGTSFCCVKYAPSSFIFRHWIISTCVSINIICYIIFWYVTPNYEVRSFWYTNALTKPWLKGSCVWSDTRSILSSSATGYVALDILMLWQSPG